MQALTEIGQKKKTLEDAFEGQSNLARIDARDRAFARALVAMVLRRRGQIDDMLGRYLHKRLPPKAHEAETLLRIGAAQLLFMNIPAHAAVDTAVGMAVGNARAPYRKMINAVLRSLDRTGRSELATQDPERLNTPDWLWQSWSDAYGEETCRAIAHAHLMEPPLDVSIGLGTPADWAERLNGTILPSGTIRLSKGGRPESLEGFEQGAWWIQDAAAAMPARLLGDISGQSVFDLCAAPGGKTAQLCTAGANTIALDRSKKRLRRLSDNLERLNLSARTVVADASMWKPDCPADAILLDAPCSATGTIRRHPDVAWSKTLDDVSNLAAMQKRLLIAAADMLRPGGTLVYCTCSLQPEEGFQQITDFLAQGAPFGRVPVTPAEAGGLAEAITDDGDLRTLPCHWAKHGGMDGFYACRLKRMA